MKPLYVVLIVILFLFMIQRGKADEVTPGTLIETELAILCFDVEAAKALADAEENFQALGETLVKSGVCGIAGGRMVVVEFVYRGKTLNVFKTKDSSRVYYWVTLHEPTSV